ncbi:MAG: hypothetical protein D084_Lepto4C00287G0005 [Leptospirillum sp. Group IV 'UBA BS']|nr:MAG: hypothetical protein D084_Lepto4C00287G0005 [Leptospirillum sp. Group IV 'UBA BS']
MSGVRGEEAGLVLLVGAFPLPPVAESLMTPQTTVIFYGEGVNHPWSGEENLFYLLQDVEGRGRAPFSQCLTDEQCVERLLAARKVLTF